MRSVVIALERLRLVVPLVVRTPAEAVQVVGQRLARRGRAPPDASTNAICKLERALRKTIVSSLVRLPRVFS